jgi:histidinol-phosphate aminotransferase
MAISRRGFVQTLGAGLAATTVPPALPALGQALRFEPLRARRPDGAILLNSNENPYGPSKKVKERLTQALAVANRYPVSEDDLRKHIAALHKVEPKRVLIGCGSTEMIRVLSAALLGPRKSLILASPTFEAFAHYAKDWGANIIAVPLDHEYAHDLDTMLARVDHSTALIYICNPNNPTASITPRRKIEEFVAKLPPELVVVIDEAYHHFVAQSAMYVSFLDQPVAPDRVVVLRTFSKAFGLAGVRIGYAIAPPQLAASLAPYMTDRGVSELGLQAAIAALDDEQGLRLAVKRNTDDRQEFFNQAQARMLKPIDSKTNFIMMDIHHPADGAIEHFRKNNILIGPEFPPMKTHIRISFGAPDNMKEFWRVWDMLPYSHGMRM